MCTYVHDTNPRLFVFQLLIKVQLGAGHLIYGKEIELIGLKIRPIAIFIRARTLRRNIKRLYLH